MKKRVLFIVTILLIALVASAFAATPSLFEIGLLNYYKLQDLTDSDFAAYTPGLRASVYINNWFGLSGDAILSAPFNVTGDEYTINLSGDIVFRAPLGFFEMYGAFGPIYTLQVSADDIALEAKVNYSGRIGFDFNITPIFGIGVEALHVVSDIPALINGAEYDLMGSTYVGVTAKLKL